MFLVGLTGGIATGKSTVSNMLSSMGVTVIDADLIAREVVRPGQQAWKQIKSEFGDDILKADGAGEIDREKLADIVFSDAQKRRRLNAIVHPQVHRRIFWMVIKYFFQGNRFLILDLPLLMEAGTMIDYFHKIIVVSCDEDQQVSRLTARNGLPEVEARKRIAAQMPLDMKCRRAHIVIDNSASIADTRLQVQRVCKTLMQSRRHWRLRFIIVAWLSAAAAFVVWLGTNVWRK